jgi:hypothetical protein
MASTVHNSADVTKPMVSHKAYDANSMQFWVPNCSYSFHLHFPAVISYLSFYLLEGKCLYWLIFMLSSDIKWEPYNQLHRFPFQSQLLGELRVEFAAHILQCNQFTYQQYIFPFPLLMSPLFCLMLKGHHTKCRFFRLFFKCVQIVP